MQHLRLYQYLVTRRGIEANPEQIRALEEVEKSKTVKDVQRLTGMAAALNRFISKSSDKCRPFFRSLQKCSKLNWTEDCDLALEQLKAYLSSPPLLSQPVPEEDLFLYLAISEHAVSAVLFREVDKEQKPVYYVSRTYTDVETRYLPLKKLVLALVMASKKLVHYFLGHTICVYSEHPLKSLLQQSDLSGRIARWAVQLGQFV